MADYIDAVEGAFEQLHQGRIATPAVVHIAAIDGAFHVKSAASLADPGYVAVKVNGNFPGNPAKLGLPTIQGAIVLCDLENGSLLAVMDSAEITAMRTAAATAVAAKYLAAPSAHTMTIIGCGVQGRVQLLALTEVLPLRVVYAYDIDHRKARRFATDMRAQVGIEVVPVHDLAAGTLHSQAIVTCTSSRDPFLGKELVAPGTFISAVGADNDDKHEIHASLLAESVVVVDSLEQCSAIGDLHHALACGAMSTSDAAADLASVVAGAVDLRRRPSDITIFDSTGLAIQDVASAGVVYERATAQGVGHALSLS